MSSEARRVVVITGAGGTLGAALSRQFAGEPDLFAAVVGWLGYILSTFLLFTAWLSFIDRKKWAVILPLACLAAVAAYCFNVLFSVQLPPGLLKGIVK